MSEAQIQRDIQLALGTEADLLLFKNSVGLARHVDYRTGRSFHVPYGLLAGSPDLVGILAPEGRWFCLEVKQPGERPTAEQLHCHDVWRAAGAFVAVVTSVVEAKAALGRARAGGRS